MDHAGTVEEFARDECLTRMATQRLGRLGVVVDEVPLVFPMQFALDGETVVLQTNQGTKVFHAPLTSVSFEVDHVDWEQGVGWSVLVQGFGEDISTGNRRTLRGPSLTLHPVMGAAARRSLAEDRPRKITGRLLRAG